MTQPWGQPIMNFPQNWSPQDFMAQLAARRAAIQAGGAQPLRPRPPPSRPQPPGNGGDGPTAPVPYAGPMAQGGAAQVIPPPTSPNLAARRARVARLLGGGALGVIRQRLGG